MGNCLEDYRCRIGRFSNNKVGKIKHIYENNSREMKCYKLIPGIFLLLSLVCLFSTTSFSGSSLLSSFGNFASTQTHSYQIKNHTFLARYKI